MKLMSSQRMKLPPLKENSLRGNIYVDDEETIHSRERDRDAVKHIAFVSDHAQAFCSYSANNSRDRNEAKDLTWDEVCLSSSESQVQFWNLYSISSFF